MNVQLTILVRLCRPGTTHSSQQPPMTTPLICSGCGECGPASSERGCDRGMAEDSVFTAIWRSTYTLCGGNEFFLLTIGACFSVTAILLLRRQVVQCQLLAAVVCMVCYVCRLCCLHSCCIFSGQPSLCHTRLDWFPIIPSPIQDPGWEVCPSEKWYQVNAVGVSSSHCCNCRWTGVCTRSH